MSFSVGDVVVSTAGHDKGSYGIVIAVENGFAWVANGKTKRIDDPKKKNLRHLMYVCSSDSATVEQLVARCGVFSKASGTGYAKLRAIIKDRCGRFNNEIRGNLRE